MNNAAFFIFILAAGIFVKIITGIIKFDDYNIAFDNPQKNGLTIIIVLIFIISITILNCTYIPKHITGMKYIIFSSFLELLPVVIVCCFQHSTLESIGITTKNLIKSILLGVCLFGLLLLIFHFFYRPDKIYYPMNQKIIILIKFLILGFTEEVIFRGYIQIRLTVWLGKTKGIVLTALLFSFIHLPSRLISEQLNFMNALISSFTLIPIALLLGYIMLKNKNIASSTIVHAGVNWVFQVMMSA